MSELMREEFEVAWHEIRSKWVSGGMQEGGLRGLALEAWENSRAALCVELPKPCATQFETDFEFSAACDFVEECREAIHAVGVKTK